MKINSESMANVERTILDLADKISLEKSSVENMDHQSKHVIPFNKASLVGNEIEYILQAITNGHISGDGTFTKKCNQFLENELRIPKILLTTSCTHALEMAAILLDLQPGDEVIIPSFTFVSTANAFYLHGAKIVFSDIRQDTLNLDENQLESLITPHTKAIIPVHYAGVGCEMDIICQVADHYGVSVIEDNAHGLFGKYKGRYLGTFGELAAQSFHETKNFTCGEGGALLINDPTLIERAEIVREKGTNRSRFFRGQVDKYTWVDIGSSYLPSEILAAFLYAQIENWENIQRTRQEIWDYYFKRLHAIIYKKGIQLPFVPENCDQAYHMFYLILPSLEKRTELINHLKSEGILSVFHYIPLHLSSMAVKWGYKEGDCPNTESVSDRLVRLPFYNSLSQNQQDKICQAIEEVIKGW